MENAVEEKRKSLLVGDLKICTKCGNPKSHSEYKNKKYTRKDGVETIIPSTICYPCQHGIKHPGQHKERSDMLDKGLIWCSDCKAYKAGVEFNKSNTYHTGYSTICRDHSKQRARLKKEKSYLAAQGVKNAMDWIKENNYDKNTLF